MTKNSSNKSFITCPNVLAIIKATSNQLMLTLTMSIETLVICAPNNRMLKRFHLIMTSDHMSWLLMAMWNKLLAGCTTEHPVTDLHVLSAKMFKPCIYMRLETSLEFCDHAIITALSWGLMVIKLNYWILSLQSFNYQPISTYLQTLFNLIPISYKIMYVLVLDLQLPSYQSIFCPKYTMDASR
jgi:hypothetical protein